MRLIVCIVNIISLEELHIMYKVGDKVKFYIDVLRDSPVEGEIIEVFEESGRYKILYENSRFNVHKRFVVAKIIDDKFMIQVLREKIGVLAGAIKWRQKIIDEQRKELTVLNEKVSVLPLKVMQYKRELDECQKIIEEQRNKIMHCNAKELLSLSKERGYYYINTRR
jgi:hypothetical protein